MAVPATRGAAPAVAVSVSGLDQLNRALRSRELFDAVRAANGLYGPYQLEYTAVDSLGGRGTAKRTVFILDACPGEEVRCDDGECSSSGICGLTAAAAALLATGDAADPEPFVPTVDTNPPVITVRPRHAKSQNPHAEHPMPCM